MADTKISLLDPITAPQDPAKMFVPLFAQDGTPLNARMNFAEMFKTPKQLTLNASSAGSSVIFTTPADGRLLLTDNAGTSFGRLQLGGTTASFPSLKRNATGIDFRLADDSGYAPITAAAIISSTTIAATAGVSGTKFTASNTVTADSPAFDAAQTWNNAAITFTGMKLNVTDAASNAASELLRCNLAGSHRFSVDKAGNVAAAQGVYASGNGYFRGGVLILGSSEDVVLTRDAADVLALCRSTNAELVRVYETYTDSTTFSRGVFGFRDDASGGTGTGSATTVLRIGTEKGSVGGTARAVSIVTGGTERWSVGATTGHLLAGADGACDIGQSAANRPRNIFSSSGVSFANALAVHSGTYHTIIWNNGLLGWTASGSAQISSAIDTALGRSSSGIVGITNGSTGPGKLAIDNVQGTNLERLKMEWNTNVARIGTSKGGSGTAREFAIITDDTERVKVRADAGSVTITGGTVTSSSKPILNTTQTWNDAAVDFVGFKQNITITAANTNSLLFDWQVGGTSYLKLTQFGDLVGSAFTGSDFSVRLQNGSLKLGSASIVSWGSGNAAGSMDSGLARVAAGIVGVTNASTGGGAIEFTVMTAPATPAADKARIFARDNGSGKTQVCVILPDGVVTVLATQT